jgi:histidine triad (HIT) family protein
VSGGGETVTGCVFCRIVRGDEPATIVATWRHALAFVPLNPVAEGHVLVVPRRHTSYATEDPLVAGYVFVCAAEIAPTPSNLITSSGVDATQTVFHLHVHVVPRAKGDGLALPWTAQSASPAGLA